LGAVRLCISIVDRDIDPTVDVSNGSGQCFKVAASSSDQQDHMLAVIQGHDGKARASESESGGWFCCSADCSSAGYGSGE
jgi:hypothetical protein